MNSCSGTHSENGHGCISLNGERIDVSGYLQYHKLRIQTTLGKLRELGGKKIVEVGGHPWAMTAAIVDDPQLELCATVSAEEVTAWPDEIPLVSREYEIETSLGRLARFTNYSANIERTLFPIHESPDAVLACEIVEHLIRAPHVMFLNINRWLPPGGRLLLTTPNGCQFANPFRKRAPYPAYRSSVYERHAYLFTLDGLVDLISACGFRIVGSGFWDVYRRARAQRVYDLLARVPVHYFRQKFARTIYVLAEKQAELPKLARIPKVYDPRGTWEFIEENGSSGKCSASSSL